MPRPPEYEDDTPQQRRNTIMQRRLRAARGEPEYAEDDRSYADEEDFDPRRWRRRPAPEPAPPPASSGTGCAQATLYVVLGALAALLIMLFFLNQTISGIGNIFSPSSTARPTSTPVIRADAAAVVQRIQSLQRLETTSYTLDQTFTATSTREDTLIPLPPGMGEERLILIARGNIEAGVDLAKLGPEDVVISPDGSTLTITLPPVEIFSVTLDNSATRVIDRDTEFLALDNPNLESDARRYAETSIYEAACESNILQRATGDSQQAMEQLLSLLDFEQITVRTSSPAPCIVPDSPTSPTTTTP